MAASLALSPWQGKLGAYTVFAKGTCMRLDHLHLQNFRCYEDAHFDFKPGFNLLVGVNGSGKSSLLRAVAGAFAEFADAMRMGPATLVDDDLRFVIDKFEGKTRFERKLPLVITGKGALSGLAEWCILQDTEQMLQSSDLALANNARALRKRITDGEAADLPVLAFYRANRQLAGANVSAESAVQQQLSRLDGYLNWFDAVSDLKDFESWLISKTLERMQSLLEAGPASVTFDDELAWVNGAIGIAIPNIKNLRYDLRLKSLLVDVGGQHTIPFNSLSDGQRGLVVLIADIARRMCVLNPHMAAQVLKGTAGVILIDELDLHLHPAWQRNIAPALKRAFPAVQFIAASHSPQIIGSLAADEVIVLGSDSTSHPQVTFGLDSSRVLEEVMGVAQREPAIEADLQQLFSTLESNDISKSRQLLEALKAKAPDLPEYARAEARLKRKEVLGR
jgi:predicted ATP-binding protein involved in virulence